MPPLTFIWIDWITEDELRGKKREPQYWTDGLPPAAAISVPDAATPKCVVAPLTNHVNVDKYTVELKVKQQ